MMWHIKNFNTYFSSDDEDSIFIERRPNFLGNVNNLQSRDDDLQNDDDLQSNDDLQNDDMDYSSNENDNQDDAIENIR